METDSATLHPVLAGTRTAVVDADRLLPPSASIARFPGLRLTAGARRRPTRILRGFERLPAELS